MKISRGPPPLFFFFIFACHFLKQLKFVWGQPKWEFFFLGGGGNFLTWPCPPLIAQLVTSLSVCYLELAVTIKKKKAVPALWSFSRRCHFVFKFHVFRCLYFFYKIKLLWLQTWTKSFIVSKSKENSILPKCQIRPCCIHVTNCHSICL